MALQHSQTRPAQQQQHLQQQQHHQQQQQQPVSRGSKVSGVVYSGGGAPGYMNYPGGVFYSVDGDGLVEKLEEISQTQGGDENRDPGHQEPDVDR